ncbi:hypothetical protein LOD44_07205 [Xylella fastidiosa subsp. multiplex]|uniref:hypothetical protein n=2 Tax=Xylella fastidiosa TaxID=2371 RepID=UPI0003042027|nr:hypothetical protein [Xylella fastidiosa]KAJ4852182.1 hypothetical protein XYFPCFBP8418_009910 [Xylella fastidiosa subsp. multiplex]MBE0269032.1 hypothetical protein [Xylella fastidiosa subsp. multiplex]MBE0275760.1 hypothetical protein [Xylella fastidiosa subsp. multiplex]MBE0277915.1 hypothetical protein [Xylella fastidiosa subsp. multiplex]MBE0282129.1 hypothetical protein [Xylella fastidiosa subsp. multiplex]
MKHQHSIKLEITNEEAVNACFTLQRCQQSSHRKNAFTQTGSGNDRKIIPSFIVHLNEWLRIEEACDAAPGCLQSQSSRLGPNKTNSSSWNHRTSRMKERAALPAKNSCLDTCPYYQHLWRDHKRTTMSLNQSYQPQDHQVLTVEKCTALLLNTRSEKQKRHTLGISISGACPQSDQRLHQPRFQRILAEEVATNMDLDGTDIQAKKRGVAITLNTASNTSISLPTTTFMHANISFIGYCGVEALPRTDLAAARKAIIACPAPTTAADAHLPKR